MAKETNPCTQLLEFSVNGEAYKIDYESFLGFLGAKWMQVHNMCELIGVPVPEGEYYPPMACADCGYAINGSTFSESSSRFVSMDGGHGCPCKYHSNANVQFVFRYMDKRDGTQFLASVQCAGYEAVVLAMVASEHICSDEKTAYFEHRPLKDFLEGKADPRDYAVNRPSLVARLARRAADRIRSLFGNSS